MLTLFPSMFVQVPLKQEVEVDQCVAMQMNDPTNTVGVQRGVWVVGMVEDACVEVAKACSVDRSLVLVTPATVMQQAMVAAVSRFFVFFFFGPIYRPVD